MEKVTGKPINPRPTDKHGLRCPNCGYLAANFQAYCKDCGKSMKTFGGLYDIVKIIDWEKELLNK